MKSNLSQLPNKETGKRSKTKRSAFSAILLIIIILKMLYCGVVIRSEGTPFYDCISCVTPVESMIYQTVLPQLLADENALEEPFTQKSPFDLGALAK